MIERGVKHQIDLFDYAMELSTTPGMNGWAIYDESTSGTPTYLSTTEDGGSVKLTLTNTSEAQIVTLYQKDVLIYDLAKMQFVSFTLKVSGIDAVTTLVAGLASARNNTADSVATNAWFRMEGSASTSALVVESDDGTNDNNDKATGKSLSSTYLKCLIDFTNGLSDVRFFIDGDRVADGTTFDMSDVSSGTNVQPFVQLQKASGTGTPSVQIVKHEAQYSYAYGA